MVLNITNMVYLYMGQNVSDSDTNTDVEELIKPLPVFTFKRYIVVFVCMFW